MNLSKAERDALAFGHMLIHNNRQKAIYTKQAGQIAAYVARSLRAGRKFNTEWEGWKVLCINSGATITPPSSIFDAGDATLTSKVLGSIRTRIEAEHLDVAFVPNSFVVTLGVL